MKALASVLLTWIGLQLAVEPPAPPDIEFVSHERLVELAYGPDAPAEASITALYDRSSGTVFLDHAWRADSLRDRSTLVHELVHHVQERSGQPYPCVAARERDAYQLQANWLRQNGVVEPYAFLGIDKFTVFVTAMCIGA